MNNKYQVALNKIIRSCCSYCHDDNGCQNCKIKHICNAIAKDWVDTLQELIDKETPMKVTEKWSDDCPKCGEFMIDTFEYALHNIPFIKYCPHCGQKLDWSDTDE